MSKRLDLVGQKFGRLTVIEFAGMNKWGGSLWKCECECGNQVIKSGFNLRQGKTKSCGCLPPGNPRKDLVGKKFHRLTVISFSRIRKNHILWLCQCNCGKIREVDGWQLSSGETKSCGCFSKESLIKRQTTHGMSRLRPYTIWEDMKQRCNNPLNSNYHNYGKRGIKICFRWEKSFIDFWEDMHKGYSDSLQIDRINNDGNYEPGNCQWVTQSKNLNNRRNSKHDSPKITPTP